MEVHLAWVREIEVGRLVVKRALSISLGNSQRNKRVELELLGERVVVERIGMDGDVARVAALYAEMDGQVDAFGVGGMDLAMGTTRRTYPLRAARRMVRGVQKTPIVDGRGLKHTLERQCMQYVEAEIGAELQPKRALVNVGVDRFGMAESLAEVGYELVFGDLQFGLGIPLPLKSLRSLDRVAAILGPLVSYAPIEWLYPMKGPSDKATPRFGRWYDWATIIAGDCIYTKRHLPERLPGKTILTNTTTAADVERFRATGARYLITTTPHFEGRSFGTNMMEAALVAVAGKGRALTHAELREMIAQLDLHPHIQQLNP